MNDHRQRAIVLTGLMGTGKTTTGRLVATRLGRPLRDSDVDLRHRHGATAAELASRYGAERLHAMEADHLAAALADTPPPVIAAAASVIEDARAMELLREPYVVLLDGPPPVLAERMLSSGHRPHFSPDLVAMLTDQRDRRLPSFRAVANAVFDVSTTAPVDIAAAVVAATHCTTLANVREDGPFSGRGRR